MADFNQFLTIPYVNKGRAMDGADCWGLVRLIYKDHLGILLPSYEGVDAENEEETTGMILRGRESGDWVEIGFPDRQPYDLVLMQCRGTPWHIGLTVDPFNFIHAHPIRGMNLCPFSDKSWSRRRLGLYRLSR